MPGNRFSTLEATFDASLQADDAPTPSLPAIISPSAFDDDPFDYESLPLTDEEKRTVRDLRHRVITGWRSAALLVGALLLKIKPLVIRGGDRAWTNCLETLPFSVSSAYNYMAAAEAVAQSPMVGDMSLRAIYRTASAPPKVKEEVFQRLAKKQIPRLDEIEDLIAMHGDATKPQRAVEARSRAAKQPFSQDLEERDGARQIGDHVAIEIVAHLREQFDDAAVDTLIELIGKTSYSSLRSALSASRN